MKSKFIIVAFFLSGMLMVFMRMFDTLGKGSSLYSFLLIIFGVGFIVAFMAGLRKKIVFTRKEIIVGAVIGLCSVLAFVFMLKSLTILPGVVVFPVVGGGNPILAVILIHVIFREKLGIKEILGIGVGCSGIILLSI